MEPEREQKKHQGFEHGVEKVFEAPVRAVEGGIAFAKREEHALANARPMKRAGEYWDSLGPGLTTGAADDDPSGIVTYSQAGAAYGFQLIWLTLFTYPFMATVQEMCARIGLASGEGLAANIRRHFPAYALYLMTGLLFAANTFNIAADLGAMAAATRLLAPSFSAGFFVVMFAAFILGLQLFTTYARYAKILKYLVLALLSYVAVAFAVGLDWGEVLRHLVVPSITFSADQLLIVCAVLGTTISPYLFFWQTSQEVEEDIQRGETTLKARRQVTAGLLRKMRIDVWSGMFFSNLIAFFIFAACAGTLYASGVTHIATADQAALALREFGDFAFLLFALGIVGTGLLSVPVLAGSAAYALAESFKWKEGLHYKLKQARAFYGVIIVAMVLGVVANFLHLDPIRTLIWVAVANGIIAPVVLYFVVKLSGDKRIMGEHVNRPLVTGLGWLTIILMSLAGLGAIASFF